LSPPICTVLQVVTSKTRTSGSARLARERDVLPFTSES
jgi:hypothetical protein